MLFVVKLATLSVKLPVNCPSVSLLSLVLKFSFVHSFFHYVNIFVLFFSLCRLKWDIRVQVYLCSMLYLLSFKLQDLYIAKDQQPLG